MSSALDYTVACCPPKHPPGPTGGGGENGPIRDFGLSHSIKDRNAGLFGRR